MGNCWTQCYGMFRREANRIQRGGGSKYFRSSTTGEHYTIEFENLVESDEGETPRSSPRPVSEEEMVHLREQRYTAISDTQRLIDQKLQAESEAREESLRQEEEAQYAAQREAARAARERMHTEKQAAQARTEEDGCASGHQKTLAAGEDFDTHPSNMKTETGGASRSSRVSSETNVVTPNTESSYDVTSKTRSTNEDGTSLDLEWEDEEGMSAAVLVPERSRTEEDILKAAAAAAGREGPRGSYPASASEDSNALEWENDFVSAHGDDFECDGFVNPLVDTPSEVTTETSISDKQDR
ncbi:hypothetical protein SKAU_G00396200 [Synaphobranchus kaupii]|uniref:Uncharacterized protein n=1 Tax=Synaphobranchus kaupii TaxID=118154 RepID=A0A9Q1ECJ1_SYNKA|nr:hypothetical protein SKAU_G00396200 [Synaphobranchus kaupii]